MPECEALAELVATSAHDAAEARARCVDLSIDHDLDCRSLVRLAEAVERRTGWSILSPLASPSGRLSPGARVTADRYFRDVLSLKRR